MVIKDDEGEQNAGYLQENVSGANFQEQRKVEL